MGTLVALFSRADRLPLSVHDPQGINDVSGLTRAAVSSLVRTCAGADSSCGHFGGWDGFAEQETLCLMSPVHLSRMPRNMRTSTEAGKAAFCERKTPGDWALGGFCLELRPLWALWGRRGMGTRQSNVDVSGAALRAAIGVWCNAIARPYGGPSTSPLFVHADIPQDVVTKVG